MDDPTFSPLWAGVAAVTIALVAWLADRRRRRRSDPDAVGFMPWTTVSLWSTAVALVLLAWAGKDWFGG